MAPLEDQIKSTRTALKKIASGRGVVKGAFYFWRRDQQTYLAVTLARRDPRGKKVVRETRALLGSEPDYAGGRFVYGTVSTDPENTGKKLIFHLHALEGVGQKGKLPVVLFTQGLRKLWVKQTQGMAFLKQAIIRKETGEDDVDGEALTQEDADGIDADLQLSSEDEAELELLLRDQQALALATEGLARGLQPDARAEVQTLLAEALVLAEEGADAEAVRAKRAQLAHAIAVGPDLPIEPGAMLPPEVVAVLGMATDAMNEWVEGALSRAMEVIRALHEQARAAADDPVALAELSSRQLGTLLRAEDDLRRSSAERDRLQG